jgi:6-phosphogluconolactonase/glucosamine-6-phosphate isomerase/deaminase
MKIEVLDDADAVADEAAAIIATDARIAVAARGRFVMAVSGGRTPWLMLRALADKEVPWNGVQVLQVDERVAPAGDPDRNLTRLRESLLGHAPLRAEQIHAMPVESDDLQAAASSYAATLHLRSRGPSRCRPDPSGPGPTGPPRSCRVTRRWT